ncbi:hypothetical protein R1flu_017039 [Riccia fluitans]|uniref:Uncharacterized protein n=1 Tax=Riccia fluitans TaxID=41844 RepID=A0ABD1YNU5_9MARC
MGLDEIPRVEGLKSVNCLQACHFFRDDYVRSRWETFQVMMMKSCEVELVGHEELFPRYRKYGRTDGMQLFAFGFTY